MEESQKVSFFRKVKGIFLDYKPLLPKILETLRNFFLTSGLVFFPLKPLFKGYNKEKAKKDIHSGINVALLDFPQAMAYALVAGLPPQLGVYSSSISSIVGPFFSSSRYVVLGPTNATAVLVLSAFLAMSAFQSSLPMLGVLVFMVGLFLILGSFLGVARLVQYVSRSVSIGYITAAACLIVVNQIHLIFGMPLEKSTTFFDILGRTLHSIPLANPVSLFIALLTFAIWWKLDQKMPHFPVVAITLLAISIVGWGLGCISPGFKTSTLEGIPFFSLSFSFPEFTWTSLRQLSSSALAIAILITLEGISICKTLASNEGEKISSNQQMLSFGVANLACSVFGSMPASGSLTRSVLNYKSGAKTPMSSIISGAILAVGILFLGPFLSYIPKAALATLVVLVAFSLVNPRQIKLCVRSTKADMVVFYTTFLAGLLFPLDFAVYLGVGISIILFLKAVAEPELVEYTFNEEGNLCPLDEKGARTDPHISIIHVEGELFFGASELFGEEVRRVCASDNVQVVILRMKNARHLDATCALALFELIHYLQETNRHLIVSGASKEVYKVFKNSGLLDILGRDNFFIGSAENPNVSTRNALKRAQQLIGSYSAEVRIYFDPNKAT